MPDQIIDVLIPVFNGQQFIRTSIESIQNQTINNIGIHIVDDGSTDGTSDILRDLAALDKRICVHSQSNTGIVEALNAGLRHCTAEFVARHDADDIAYPQRFEEQLETLRSRPELVAIGGSARHIDTKGRPLGTVTRLVATENADPSRIPAKEPYLLHPFLMVRRDAIMAVGGYRHVVHAEDSDLYWRLQEKSALFSDQRIQGEYRMHADSISSQSVRNGRVLAVSSQLSALSARRRRAGQADMTFTRDDGARLKAAAASLDEACTAASRQLTPDEARHLRLAAGAKLLETADYRPYELEMSDCLFIRKAFEESDTFLTGETREFALISCCGSAARLAAAGRWREARILLRPGMTVAFAARVGVRLLLPQAFHHRLRDLFKRLRAGMRKPR